MPRLLLGKAARAPSQEDGQANLWKKKCVDVTCRLGRVFHLEPASHAMHMWNLIISDRNVQSMVWAPLQQATTRGTGKGRVRLDVRDSPIPFLLKGGQWRNK